LPTSTGLGKLRVTLTHCSGHNNYSVSRNMGSIVTNKNLNSCITEVIKNGRFLLVRTRNLKTAILEKLSNH
jgi:hypothetical protein